MDNHDRLVGALFENLHESDWASAFLQGICTATRSHAASVLAVDFVAQRYTLPAYVGEGRAAAEAFEQVHAAANPWSPSGGPAHPAGTVVVPDNALPLSELRRTAFWSDFLRRMNVDHGVGIIGQRSPERALSLTLLRSARVGIYDARERAWLAALARHWVNACELRSRLLVPDREGWEATRALDRLSTAAFFLDRTGRCVRWNTAGERLLQESSLVRLRGGYLHSVCPGSGPAALALAGPTVLRRCDGGVAGHAVAHALPGHGPMGAAGAVLFVDLVGTGRPTALREALVAVYGLTTREAELAAGLAEGLDLPAVANAMGLSNGSARTRLKVVFEKTGVRHQGELVVLVVSLHRTLTKD